MRRPDFHYPELLSGRAPQPPRALVWFLAGSVSTLGVLALLGVLP